MACCCAMLTGTTLDYVLDKVQLDLAGHLPMQEAFRFLINHGYCPGLSLTGEFVTKLTGDFEINWTNYNALVTVVSDNEPDYKKSCHLVTWDANEQCVRDPNPDRPETGCLGDYLILDYTPVSRI